MNRIQNTFNLPVVSENFFSIKDPQEIPEIISKYEAFIILGGGSNVLFTKNYIEKPVITVVKDDIQILRDTSNFIDLEVSAGKNWDTLVKEIASQGLYGIENLVAIPGNVGTAPIQNIGAYGCEIKDTLIAVKGYNKITGKNELLTKEELNLGYRTSIFKTELKNKFIITSVILRLKKSGELNLEYSGIKEKLKELGYKEPFSPREVATAIEEIRWNKLPKPSELGNAGSFFKNPIISAEELNKLKQIIPDLKYYKHDDKYKVPAGFLIEKAGWKGKRIGNVGTYPKQALVIVNYGADEGSEIVSFAGQIQKDVYNKYGIKLEPEVNIID